MPINPNIALAARPVEIADPMAMYGKIAAIQGAQQQNALAQYQLGAAQRQEAATNALSKAYQEAYDPQTGGIDRNRLRQSLATGGFGAQIPTVEKALGELDTQALTRQKTENELFDQAMGQIRNMWGNVRTVDDAIAVHDITHRDPIINKRLKALGVTEEMGRQQILQASQNPNAFAEFVKRAQLGAAKFAELNRPTTQVINRMGQTDIAQTPGLGGVPTIVGSFADVPLPPAVAAQKKEIARAGAPSITVSTEKKYGERFGGLIAERDAAKLEAAEKAPQLASDANRIIDLVKQGNVFTGPAADIKLNIARALNIAGADNQEKIANTEALVAGTGQSTLNAIKGAGLGAGQGFTDKDLKFLQGVAGGTINLTQQTLAELARLQHQAAVKSAESWNRRVKELPQDALRGTGLSTEPIVVPPLSSVMKGKGAAAPTRPVPAGVDPVLWNIMTPQEQAAWPTK